MDKIHLNEQKATPKIKPLNADHIRHANSNSMSGNRGKISNHDYEIYAHIILGWPVSDEKKVKLLDKLYRMFSEKLRYEAQHVSVMVAGPANYNAQRLDKSDQILEKAHEIATWFEKLERELGKPDDDGAGKAEHLIEMIRFCDNRPELLPNNNLMKLAFVDNASFIALYEELQPKYKWRKNSGIAQLYARSKAGEVTEIRKEIKVEHPDYVGYTEGNRAYIRFMLRPQRQLIVALKSRKWWWNSLKGAWSTYLDRADWEWVASIGERYGRYI